MTTNNITTQKRDEAVIDSEIAEAWATYTKAHNRAQAAKLYAKRSSNQIAYIAERAADDLAAAIAAADQAHAAYLASAERYNGWSRFFLVTNSNGHIHSSMNCSTCYYDTAFSWLPELSGLTEADAVAEYGEILCSICFPTAPVEWTTGTNKKTAAEKNLVAALREIERSPEGKKVKAARQLVSRKQHVIETHERSISRWAECAESPENVPAWFAADAEKANVALPKVRKELARAEAKLAAAEAALDAALAGN